MEKIKVVLMFMALFFVPAVWGAQDLDELKDSTPEERANVQTEWMKTALKLDAGQTAAVDKINRKYSQKNQELLAADGSRLSKLRKYRESSKAKDKELKAVFTKDQYSQYQATKDELKVKLKEKRKH